MPYNFIHRWETIKKKKHLFFLTFIFIIRKKLFRIIKEKVIILFCNEFEFKFIHTFITFFSQIINRVYMWNNFIHEREIFSFYIKKILKINISIYLKKLFKNKVVLALWSIKINFLLFIYFFLISSPHPQPAIVFRRKRDKITEESNFCNNKI